SSGGKTSLASSPGGSSGGRGRASAADGDLDLAAVRSAGGDGSALASRLERAHHRRQLRLGAGERLRGREGDHLVPAVPVSEQATVVLEIERLRVTPQVEHRAAGQGLAAQVLELRQTALHLVDHRPLELV